MEHETEANTPKPQSNWVVSGPQGYVSSWEYKTVTKGMLKGIEVFHVQFDPELTNAQHMSESEAMTLIDDIVANTGETMLTMQEDKDGDGVFGDTVKYKEDEPFHLLTPADLFISELPDYTKGKSTKAALEPQDAVVVTYKNALLLLSELRVVAKIQPVNPRAETLN